MAFIASSEAYDYGSESNSDSNKVFSNLTRSQVEFCLTKILEKFQSLQNRHKDLKRIYVADSETISKLKKENSNMKEKLSVLEKYISTLKIKSKELEKEIPSEAPMESNDVIKKYDTAFQKFLAQNIDRSKMTSMIYGISRNEKKKVLVIPHHGILSLE